MNNLMICLLAFKSIKKGNFYLEKALNLIEILQTNTSLPITIMTDSFDYFKNKQVFILDCDEISYTKKIDVCKVVINRGYTAVYIDVDTTLDFELLEKTTFQNGFHYWWWWKNELKSYNQIIDKKYFKMLENYCIDSNIEIENAPLIHEGFFVIRKDDNIEQFFTLYEKLSRVAIDNDINYGNIPTGRGEGLLIGISLINSKFKNNGCSPEMLLLGHKLKQDKSPDLKNLRLPIDNPNFLVDKTII